MDDRAQIRELITSRIGGFLRCERGAILIQSVVFSIMLLAAAGLAVDFGRYYTLNVQMQSYADHVALAAASELDRKDGAIARAQRIADGYSDGTGGTGGSLLIKESPFKAGADELTLLPLIFLSDLPDDPEPGSENYPIGDLAPFVTTSDSEAKFVVAIVEEATVNFTFSALLSIFDSEAARTASTNAVAVATLEEEICNVPPLMICNPWETTSASFPSDSAIVGTQILAKTQGPGAAWAPGNFGFLQTAAGAGGDQCNGSPNSAARIRCVFALNEPNSACVNTTVDTSPGEATSVYKGMNVRFDMWAPPLSRNSTTMLPAPNTIHGKVPQSLGQCSQNKHVAATNSVKLPRDPCFATDSCAFGRIGDKVTRAQLEDYWDDNHGGQVPYVPLPPSITTRYEVYKFELQQQKLGALSLDNLGPAGGPVSDEHGLPYCNQQVPYENLDEERRNMVMAVINCIDEGVSGNAVGVEVQRFLEVFMTEPATEPGNGNSDDGGSDLFVEVIGVVEAGGNEGILHAFPLLVR